MAEFILTMHASHVVVERELKLEWIDLALSAPDRTNRDPNHPTLCHSLRSIPERGGRVLRVVYNDTQTPWLVVTAFFDRRERSGS